MMSYILYNGLKCRLVSQYIKTDSGNLKEMFGFDSLDNKVVQEILAYCAFHDVEVILQTTVHGTYTRSIFYKRYHK